MALAMDNSVLVDTTNSSPTGFSEVGTNRGLVVYRDIDDNEDQGKIANISGDSLSFGSATVISPGADGPNHMTKLDTDKVLFVLRDATDSNRPKARVLTVASTTITAQAVSSAFENVTLTLIRVAATTTALALAFYRTTQGRYCRLAVSGNTVTPGTPSNSTTTNIFPISMTRMDDDRVLCMYRIGVSAALEFQVVDISSGLSQGAVNDPTVTLDTGDNAGMMQLARLTDDKAVTLYKPSVGSWAVRTVNLSGTTIDSFGDALSVPASGDAAAAIWPITSTKFLVITGGSSPNRPWIESFSVDGDTITADGDGGSTAADEDSLGFGVAILNNTLAVAVWQEGGGSTRATGARITGVPSSATAPGPAKFYQGTGALTEKFTLPFSGVEPGAMTLDAPLGTVVIGANTPAGQMINFGASPYNAFTNMTDGIPTGTATTGVKWI